MSFSVVILLFISAWAVLSIVASLASAKMAEARERAETRMDRR